MATPYEYPSQNRSAAAPLNAFHNTLRPPWPKSSLFPLNLPLFTLFSRAAMPTTIPELLAPAGSFESLQAAMNAGADAIYFGTEQLNMRAKSINSFALSDLKEVAALCRARNIKSYLTLNT